MLPAPAPLPRPSLPANSRAKSKADHLLLCTHSLTHGFLPNKPTLISAMKACSLLTAIAEGRTIHAQIFKTGYGADRFIATSLIQLYTACGFLTLARRVFDGIHEKDTALCTAMLVGYAENGHIKDAQLLFDEMPERDVIAWNAMLTGYAHCALPESVLGLLRKMQFSRLRPNEVTLVSALSACSQLGCLALGEWLHAYIGRETDITLTPTLNNSLIHMYAKCGKLETAFKLFLESEVRNLESWNTMITSFAIYGCGTSALSLLSQMIKLGLLPDRITFVGVLMACSHSGMIDHARECFESMGRVFGVEPKAEHYGCMVDVLSRSGRLQEAYMLMKSMPFELDAHIWGSLLAGCHTHCNYELGLEAAKSLLELEPMEEGRHIAILNLYAISGKMEDAMKVRKAISNLGIKKSYGSSTIEADGELHEFLAGDMSHHRSHEIYSMIEKIGLNL